MVGKIKELCQSKGISVYKLEKELGFGNGTIGKWSRGVPNYSRIKAVAEYFDVPVSSLTGEAQKEQPPAQGGELSGIKAEAWDVLQGMDDETLRKFIQIAKTMMGE